MFCKRLEGFHAWQRRIYTNIFCCESWSECRMFPSLFFLSIASRIASKSHLQTLLQVLQSRGRELGITERHCLEVSCRWAKRLHPPFLWQEFQAARFVRERERVPHEWCRDRCICLWIWKQMPDVLQACVVMSSEPLQLKRNLVKRFCCEPFPFLNIRRAWRLLFSVQLSSVQLPEVARQDHCSAAGVGNSSRCRRCLSIAQGVEEHKLRCQSLIWFPMIWRHASESLTRSWSCQVIQASWRRLRQICKS